MFLLHTCLRPALLLGKDFSCRGDWELLADLDWDAAGTEGAACSALSEGKRVPGGQGRGRVLASTLVCSRVGVVLCALCSPGCGVVGGQESWCASGVEAARSLGHLV